MSYEALFKPFKIGNTEIKNRFVMPPMGVGMSGSDNRFSEQSYAYYAKRAEGGFGLIITEYMCVSRDGIAYPDQVLIDDDSCIPYMRRFANLVHANGAKCFAQLHHAGYTASRQANGGIVYGPSKLPCIWDMDEIEELNTKQIKALVIKFADAAVRMKSAGFDGVEIHGAHGYLVSQFMSKLTNKRADEYGVSIAGRARFGCEIIKAIKDACGEDFPVSMRMNALDDMEGGNTVEDACAFARLFEEAGADVIDVSRGVLNSNTVIASNYSPEGWNLDNTAKIKKSVGVPVIAVGRITDPDMAETVIETGLADFVALGRQSIADPEFPNKVREGRNSEIFKCTGCLQRCQGAPCEEEDTGASCMVNPFSGKEYKWHLDKTSAPKNITIVGAGVAGLESAWILAARGHKVTVLEKAEKPGGQINLAAVPPMKSAFSAITATYMTLGKKYGVEYRFNTLASKENLEKLNPDMILLANGSTPAKPPIKGIDLPFVCQSHDVLSGKKNIAGKNVLIVGAGLVGCETADYLLDYENRITIVDMIEDMAPGLHPTARKLLLERLSKGNVFFHGKTKIEEFKEGEYDAVVLAMGQKPDHSLLDLANSICTTVYSLGDSDSPADAKKSIYQAAKLALIL